MGQTSSSAAPGTPQEVAVPAGIPVRFGAETKERPVGVFFDRGGPNKRNIVLVRTQTIDVFNPDNGDKRISIRIPSPASAASYAASTALGRLIMVGCLDGCVYLFDIDTGKTVKSVELAEPSGMGRRPSADLLRLEELHESVRRALEAAARAKQAGGTLVATSTSGEALPRPSRFVTCVADAGLHDQLLVGYSDGSAFVMKVIGAPLLASQRELPSCRGAIHRNVLHSNVLQCATPELAAEAGIPLLPPDMEDTEVGASGAASALATAAASGKDGSASANYRDNMGPVIGMQVFGGDDSPILAVAHCNGIIHCYDLKTNRWRGNYKTQTGDRISSLHSLPQYQCILATIHRRNAFLLWDLVGRKSAELDVTAELESIGKRSSVVTSASFDEDRGMLTVGTHDGGLFLRAVRRIGGTNDLALRLHRSYKPTHSLGKILPGTSPHTLPTAVTSMYYDSRSDSLFTTDGSGIGRLVPKATGIASSRARAATGDGQVLVTSAGMAGQASGDDEDSGSGSGKGGLAAAVAAELGEEGGGQLSIDLGAAGGGGDGGARKQAAEEEAARKQAAEEEAARKQAAEEEAARKQAAEEEAARKQAAEEEAARKQAAEEEAPAAGGGGDDDDADAAEGEDGADGADEGEADGGAGEAMPVGAEPKEATSDAKPATSGKKGKKGKKGRRRRK